MDNPEYSSILFSLIGEKVMNVSSRFDNDYIKLYDAIPESTNPRLNVPPRSIFYLFVHGFSETRLRE